MATKSCVYLKDTSIMVQFKVRVRNNGFFVSEQGEGYSKKKGQNVKRHTFQKRKHLEGIWVDLYG